MPGEHLLIICHTFPPLPGIGGRRWAKFAKALAQRGHTVHVVHAEALAGQTGSPWTADVRHPAIHTYALPRRYPAVVHRWPMRGLADKIAYRIWMRLLPLVTKGNALDATVFWRDQVLRTAARIIRAHGIRHVIVSGAPFRLLHHGLALKAAHPGVVLTSDLRDPWTWWDNYGHAHLPPRRFAQEQAMEQAVMLGSDHITSPHLPVLEHIRTHYPAAASKCLHLPHAIDPEDLQAPPLPREPGSYRLVYAGTMYGAQEAGDYFKALIEAFQRLEALAPQQAERTSFHLHISANDATGPMRMVREAGLERRIVFEPPCAPQEVFRRIASADAALVFIPSKNKDLIGTKFQEYFHIRVPVIHVGEPGAVSRMIEENRLGRSIRVHDLPAELPLIVTGARPLEIDRGYDTSHFLLPQVTARFAEAIRLGQGAR